MMAIKIQSALPSWDLTNQRVFLRADLNIPIKNGFILDDFRIKALLPTIDLILEKKGSIVIGTHIDRPRGFDASLSTRVLAQWLSSNGYIVSFAENIPMVHELQKRPGIAIIVLENLRFFPGEKKRDQLFAQSLAECADYYVNDAWGVMHRGDSSVTLLPALFAPEKRTIGLLVEQEIRALTYLKEKPELPFVLIMGGGKVHDKLPLIETLLPKINVLLLAPGLVIPFLKLQGKSIGASSEESTSEAQSIIHKAREYGVRIITPVDYLIAQGSWEGPLSYCSANQIPHDAVLVSIGEKTVELFGQEIKKARTLFFNGMMGDLSRPQTISELRKLLEIIAQTPAYKVIGGGDSVAAVQYFGLMRGFNYCSTGGGATIAYISDLPMPGLEIFNYYK